MLAASPDLIAVHAPARALEQCCSLGIECATSLPDYGSLCSSFGVHPRAATAMTIRTILPTMDPSSGFWAASERNGYELQAVWAMASDALATIFALTPVEVRDFLDSHGGRLLADDIGFITGGPKDTEAIQTLIRVRLRHPGWRRLYEQAISQVRAKPAPRTPRSKRSIHCGKPLYRPPQQ